MVAVQPDVPNAAVQQPPPRDLAVQVRRTTAQLLACGYPAIDDTARALAVSVRTLQRRLAGQGLTYSAVVDEVRLTRAQNLLGRTDVKLGDISAELGFKDAGSFSRAFKRWTGIEPRTFRKSTLTTPRAP